jgi:predicted ArsR family transcriptional regulator
VSKTHLGLHPSRKPRPAKPTGRQGIWTAIRGLADAGSFSERDIGDATDISRGTIRSYLAGLIAEGFIAKKQSPRGKRTTARYVLVRDCGSEAPVVGPEAKLRDVLWHTMKMLSAGGDFSIRDLAVSARTPAVAVSDHEARVYLHSLVRARYAAATTAGRFRLIQYTGPRAPIAQRLDTLFDPNVNAIVWHGEADR